MASTPYGFAPWAGEGGGKGTGFSSPEAGGAEGSNGQGSLLGLGWLRGQQSQRVRGPVPGDVQSNPTPRSELCWGQGSSPS